jgi:ubiquinone/menaquinone biosynthesis C-methylase UbiE
MNANYGIDAPKVLWRLFGMGLIGLGLGTACALAARIGFMPWLRFAAAPLFAMGFGFLLTASVMLWGSKIGKLRLRDKVLDALPWRGDERVLDVGCGHGLMLIAGAKRSPRGAAIGLDLWQDEDQAENSRESTWRNVQLEGVADRVELKDGDARHLPFPDEAFDVIVSSWALHNIYSGSGREEALLEMVRTLKPGGHLVIIDIRHTTEYAQVLRAQQTLRVNQSRPHFHFVIPSVVLTATKRAGHESLTAARPVGEGPKTAS